MSQEVTREAEMADVTQRIFGDTGIHVRFTPCTLRSWAIERLDMVEEELL